MAEVPKLLFGSGVVVKSGLLDKTQAERFKALILAKNEKALALHPILDKKPFEEEFASKVKAILAETSSTSIPLDDINTNSSAPITSSSGASTAHSSSSTSSSSSSSSSSSIVLEHDELDVHEQDHDPDHDHEHEQDVILESAVSPSKGGLAAMRAKGKAPKLNLSVVAAANKTTAAVKQDEEAQQADELLKIKRMRQQKRQSLPERLPTEVQHKVESTDKVHHNQH